MANERSSYPAGGDIPDRYARFWDPYIALSFVAARTSLEVGPTVSLVAEHDAIALAKAIATLDVLSGGRVLVGVGFGGTARSSRIMACPPRCGPRSSRRRSRS